MWVTDYTSEALERVELDFGCDSCGYTQGAVVLGHGIGMSQRFMGLGDGAGESVEEASSSAQRDAERVLKAVPCPQCGNRRWAPWLVMMAYASCAAIGLGVALLLPFVVAPMAMPDEPLVGVGIGLFAIVFVSWRWFGKAWRALQMGLNAQGRVTFKAKTDANGL